MSKKEIVDYDATRILLENIDAAERKLRMMKQYISQDKGIVRDPALVSGLFTGARDCIGTIGTKLSKFI